MNINLSNSFQQERNAIFDLFNSAKNLIDISVKTGNNYFSFCTLACQGLERAMKLYCILEKYPTQLKINDIQNHEIYSKYKSIFNKSYKQMCEEDDNKKGMIRTVDKKNPNFYLTLPQKLFDKSKSIRNNMKIDKSLDQSLYLLFLEGLEEFTKKRYDNMNNIIQYKFHDNCYSPLQKFRKKLEEMSPDCIKQLTHEENLKELNLTELEYNEKLKRQTDLSLNNNKSDHEREELSELLNELVVIQTPDDLLLKEKMEWKINKFNNIFNYFINSIELEKFKQFDTKCKELNLDLCSYSSFAS